MLIKQSYKQKLKRIKMKKIVRTLCLVAMVALVTASCKKKEEGAEFNVSFGETYGFQAGPSFDGQKAFLDPNDGFKFKWNDGDQIVVYNLSSNYQESVAEVFTADPGSEGQATARFTGEPVGAKKEHGYFVFYNANKAHRDLQEGNKETFTVSDVQVYNPTYRIDPSALVLANTLGAADGNHINSFTLQHVFGFLNVAVGGFESGLRVDNIVVTDGSWNLTGDLDIKLPEVSAQTFNSLLSELENPQVSEETYIAHLHDYLHNTLGYHAHGDRTKTITLDCTTNTANLGQEIPYHAWQYFFIPLRPGALYKGFHITINFKNAGVDPIVVDVPAGMQWLVKPGWFRNIYIGTDGNTY
jgi:hypothetical protein